MADNTVPVLPLSSITIANTMPQMVACLANVVAYLNNLGNTSSFSVSFALTANNATFAFGKTEGNLNVNNSLNFNGEPSSFYTNASNLLTGQVPYALLPIANTTVNGIVDTIAQSFAGAKTFAANAVFSANVTISDHISGNGVLLTTLNASALATGTVPTGVLGSGTANSLTYLAGNNVWSLFTVANTTVNGFMSNTVQSFGGVKTFVSEVEFGTGAGNVGCIEILPAAGTPFSGKIKYGTDNTGWKLGWDKNVGGVSNNLMWLEDAGYLSLQWGGYFAYGRSTAEGEWQNVPFSAGNFAAGGAVGTWTVASAGQTTFAYTLKGKTMTCVLFITNSSLSSTPSFLVVAVPTGFTPTQRMRTACMIDDAGTGVPGWIEVVGGSGLFNIGRIDGANFHASSNTTEVYAEITFEFN